jgi:3-hexulose-6-phosphate synthase
VAVDFIGVERKQTRLDQLKGMNPHFICDHVGIDEQGAGKKDFFSQCFEPAPGRPPLMLAGGIRPDMIRDFLPLEPRVIIVGSYVTGDQRPAEAAHALRAELTRLHPF